MGDDPSDQDIPTDRRGGERFAATILGHSYQFNEAWSSCEVGHALPGVRHAIGPGAPGFLSVNARGGAAPAGRSRMVQRFIAGSWRGGESKSRRDDTTIAQRFIAGESPRQSVPSPVGTTEGRPIPQPSLRDYSASRASHPSDESLGYHHSVPTGRRSRRICHAPGFLRRPVAVPSRQESSRLGHPQTLKLRMWHGRSGTVVSPGESDRTDWRVDPTPSSRIRHRVEMPQRLARASRRRWRDR